MTYLYTINEYDEYSNYISFRKQYFHTKNKDFINNSEKILKDHDEEINYAVKHQDPDCPNKIIEPYISKAETLILLKNFEEANKCLDIIIKYNYPQEKGRAYFLKGFISYISKDYNNALKNYIVALYQKPDLLQDLYKEIKLTNNQLYGYEKGLHKTIEQIKLFLEKHHGTVTQCFAKYEIANINYLINKIQALKEFDAVLEELKLINKEGDIDCYMGGPLAAKCLTGKIKCCLYILRNKKLTKEKKEQLVEETENSFELLDKHFIEKTNYTFSGKKYFPFTEFNIIVYRLKHIYYKLLNKENDFYNRAMQIFKEKRLKRFCFSLPKEKLDKFITKYNCSVETYKKCLENLLFNNNIDIQYFKKIDNIWNISFTKQEVEDFAINTFDRTTNYIEKYKYLLDKHIPNLNEYTFNYEKAKPIEFFLAFGFPLDFIKYLIEEKKVDYKQENIDEILKSALYMGGKGYNEYLKYFFDDLKIPVTYNFMVEICRCSFFSKEDFELFKYFVENKGYDPKTKNDKDENLLLVSLKDYRFPLNKTTENIFPVIDYLITKCKLDVNEENLFYNETVLYALLSIDCRGSKKREKNKYKIVDYLLKNYKVKIDKNSKILLQKNFIPFLKYIYKNIED